MKLQHRINSLLLWTILFLSIPKYNGNGILPIHSKVNLILIMVFIQQSVILSRTSYHICFRKGKMILNVILVSVLLVVLLPIDLFLLQIALNPSLMLRIYPNVFLLSVRTRKMMLISLIPQHFLLRFECSYMRATR